MAKLGHCDSTTANITPRLPCDPRHRVSRRYWRIDGRTCRGKGRKVAVRPTGENRASHHRSAAERHKRAIIATRGSRFELGQLRLAIAGKVSGVSLSVMKSRVAAGYTAALSNRKKWLQIAWDTCEYCVRTGDYSLNGLNGNDCARYRLSIFIFGSLFFKRDLIIWFHNKCHIMTIINIILHYIAQYYIASYGNIVTNCARF